ncbi:MAG: 3-isopropylmalate dehydrogenase [Phycisphaerales bacterium]|nr:3-isopropylmalate dehydrogenase [Phycisphaerales bacterium]
MTHTAVLIPGDGIGPEVAAAVKTIFAGASAPVRFIERQAGVSAIEAGADAVLPEETIDAIREHQLAIKGPCTTPIGRGFSSVNVGLRKKLNLWAAIRPVVSLPGVKSRYENVDLIIVRENTEGLYSGVENQVTDDVIISMKVATRQACKRIALGAFRYANRLGRRKVSVFHKANIMKMTDGLFVDQCRKVHERDYPNITYEEVIVDAGSMRLVQDPTQFDIILCENLYGDIMSDLCAGLVGGLGVTPGANHGDDIAVFEAVHGSAPDIAGQNKANPLALLMSGILLLRHIEQERQDREAGRVATCIENAYLQALQDGAKTRDIGGELGTREFAQAVIDRLKG